MPVTYPEPDSAQVAVYPPGSQQAYWLGRHGHVTGLKWSFRYPGGPDKMSCTLEVPASYRSQVLTLGWQVRVFCGEKVWSGVLDEPAPGTGFALTATGTGNLAADYLAVYAGAWGAGTPDEVVNNAIARGLPWVNPGIGSPAGIWLGQQQDPGSRTVKDLLDLCCTRGGLGWYVNAQPGGRIGDDLVLAPLPTAPNRILVCTQPVPRVSGGDIRALYLRYQVSADDPDTGTSAAYGLAVVTNTGHGGSEQYIDLSNAGVIGLADAQAVGTQILKAYRHASFAGSFDVAPGQLLSAGGVPVNLATEQAGTVCRLILADYSYGGEVSPLAAPQFITGGYEWDDQHRKATITPYQTLDQSITGLLGMTSTVMTPVAG